jgi:hypothetical protein
MRSLFGALFILVVAVAAAADPVSTLIQAQSQLVERAREYRASLEVVRELEEAGAARAEAEAQRRRDLYTRGLVSRRQAEDSEAQAAVLRAKVEETRTRIAEAEALMSETLAAIEVAKIPRAAQTEIVSTPAVIRYQGSVSLAAGNVSRLETFFAEQFGRALPVSAMGQTPVHDRLGFDHRHALDVALHPDSDEGRSLIAYLRRERIPFLAFRGPVPGASTGAHIHIGEPSSRLVPVRAPGG